MKKWYIVHTYSGQEMAVKLSLQDKIKQKNLESFFGKILIPTEDIVEIKLGKKKKAKEKFFQVIF